MLEKWSCTCLTASSKTYGEQLFRKFQGVKKKVIDANVLGEEVLT